MQPRILAPAHAAWSSLTDRGIRLLLIALALLGAALAPGARAADDFLEPDKAFQFSARAARRQVGRGDLRDRARLLPLPRAVQVRRQRRHARHAGDPAGQGQVRRDLPEERRDLSRRHQDRRSGRAGAAPNSASSSPARAAPTRACAIRRCRARRRSAWPASAAPARARIDAARRRRRRRGAARRRRRDGDRRRPGRGGGDRAIEAVLRGGSFWPIVGAFFIAGLLLSLTPCVLPMLPIVSSIIVGQGGYERRRRPVAGAAAAAAAARRPACRAGAASRSPPRIRSAWRSSTPRSASPPGWPAKASPRRCRTRGCSALSRSAWWRCRCRCSASTSCSCRRRSPAASPRRRSACPPAASPACARWAASRR